MQSDINAALKILYEILNSQEISIENKDQISSQILDLCLRSKGYNNSQNFQLSGEEYFFQNILTKINPKICLDIGANIGSYSNALLEHTEATVYAFEPLSDPFKKLFELKLLFGDRIIPINKGVSFKDDYLQIHYNRDVTVHASFSKEVQAVPYLKNDSVELIEVVSLDSYFEKFDGLVLDFIKIDTEGFEWEVLKGAKNILINNMPKIIQIEFNWHQLFRSHTLYTFSQILDGYTVYQLLPGGIIKRNPTDPYVNIFHFSNFIFIRNDLQLI